MLERVDVHNHLGVRVYTFAVADSVKSDYIAVDIQGLDPVKGEFGLRPHINYSGSGIDSARVGTRNIIFKLRYNASPGQIEGLRQHLYRYLDPKATLTLKFVYTSGNVYLIQTRIEDVESPMFTSTPETTLNFMAPDPYFYSSESISVMLETGAVIADPHSLGNAETGFYLVVYGRPGSNLYTISNGFDEDLIWSGTLTANESLEISTVRGNKYLKVRREDGSQSSGLGGIIAGTMSMTVGGLRNNVNVRTNVSSTKVNYRLTVLPKWVGL